MQRVGMGDEGEALSPRARIVDDHFQVPGRAGQQQAFFGRRVQMRNRSTTRPLPRCSSMISSMSARST